MKEQHACEETAGMIGDSYLRCGAPAEILVQHKGRTEGPYWMCPLCAWHNIRNRNGADITPNESENS